MMPLKSVDMNGVVQIIYSFLGWLKQILNALGIDEFDKNLDDAMSKLL